MALTKSGYLKAMGIEVWTTRGKAISQAAVSTEKALSPVVAAKAGNAEKDSVATTGPAAARAAAVANVVANNVQPIRPKSNDHPGAPAQEPVQDPPANAVVPNFRLALFHYEAVGLCLSLGPKEETPRRFCDDVARMMGGTIETVRYQLLQWPMLSTSGIDQSINAAREVVTQKFRQMPSKVLVFGEEVAEYYHPLSDLSPMSVGAVGAQSFLMVPSLEDFLSSGAAKRELMLVMHRWLSA